MRQLAAVYRRDSELVSSHNEVKPQNLLFDGQRIWIVDWEAAFVNDRYSDLAIVANFFSASEADERDYLAAYFGEPPSVCEMAGVLAQTDAYFSAVTKLVVGG